MSSPHLPAELLDHVVDHLHDTKHTLGTCCLVSKSWIPRTRIHLFASVRFDTAEKLRSWKETFPNPPTSPACYAKSLFVNCRCVTAEDAEVGWWISGFSRVVHLEVATSHSSDAIQLAGILPLFYGLSPAIKSLCVKAFALPSSQAFDLILSFPLLEDLSVTTHSDMFANRIGDPDGQSIIVWSPAPPMTGSLKLLHRGTNHITRRLSSLPGGIHFRKLILTWYHEEDVLSTNALVAGCSHTLESLHITCELPGASIRHRIRTENLLPSLADPTSASIDLSKAVGLKDVVFQAGSQAINWITVALRTITPRHRDLRQISIHVPYYYSSLISIGGDVRQFIGETGCQQWSDLDRILVQSWESRSIRPSVICATSTGDGKDVTSCIGSLMPEVTRMGIIDMVQLCVP